MPRGMMQNLASSSSSTYSSDLCPEKMTPSRHLGFGFGLRFGFGFG